MKEFTNQLINRLTQISFIALSITSLQVTADSGASQHGSAASKHSALAAAHGVVASAKVGSAVMAVPLIVVGVAGKASLKLGNALLEKSVAPLVITDKTITLAPSPAEMMKVNKQEQL